MLKKIGLVYVGILFSSWILFSILACVLVYHLDHEFRETNTNLNVTIGEIQSAAVDLSDSTMELAATLKVEQDAVKGQIEIGNQAAKSIQGVATNANTLLSSVNNSLTAATGLLPALTSLIHNQDAQLVSLETQAAGNLRDVDADEKQLNTLLEGTTATNAQIQVALSKFNGDLDESNLILVNLDAMAASGNRDAQMIEAKLRQALKPASLAKSILLHMLGLAGPAAEVGAAIK
jgi:chromosome segregation ATPase